MRGRTRGRVARWVCRSAWIVLALAGLPAPASAAGDAVCTTPAARFASIEGEVQVRPATQDWQKADLASRLCQGDSVRVGSKSRAALVLANEAVMRLDQNTTMRLTDVTADAGKPGVIEMLKGAVQSFIRKPRTLTVNTPYLNGSIEGTEFQVRVDDDRASLQVMEGQVQVSNAQGAVTATQGTIAEATAGSAPVASRVVRPLDAVQWTLHFPPVFSTDSAPAALRDAQQRYEAGDADGAFASLDRIAPAARDAAWHHSRAALLLAVGRVDEAQTDLDAALAAKPDDGLALALGAVLHVLRNENAAALEQAQRAVAAQDASPTRIALSYALQANFRLDEAREAVREAVKQHPKDALAWARLGELDLMLGDLAAARADAAQAATLEPDLARARTVEGFVSLARHEPATARGHFELARSRTPADPLTHLGLGLSYVAAGELAAGRSELEVAVALDPNQALLRAYLGKAYFEERRGTIDAQQFGIARTLDPKDPTAFLYDGLRKQSENRPIEALADLQQSMALNDNRAVYRSRLLLDRDRATRGASVASAYRDVGFLDAGLDAAGESLGDDPGDASAHRFLSEVYGGLRRREIARVSELLQSQMLQDFQLAPMTPSAGEANLNLAGGGAAGYNEFTSLFQRERTQGVATIGGGNHDTFGGEAALSTVAGPLSLGLGAMDWQSDGWRPNNEVHQQVYTIFGQAAVSDAFNVQAELRHREASAGDLAFNFDPDDFVADKDIDTNIDMARIGLRFAPNLRDRVLVSLIRNWRDENLDEIRPLPPVVGETTFTNRRDSKEAANQAEAQYIGRFDVATLIAGAAWTHGTRDDDAFVSVDDTVLGNLLLVDGTVPLPSRSRRGYGYVNLGRKDWLFTLGLTAEHFEQADFSKNRVSPKLGVQWQASESLRLRAAAFQTVKPTLVANRSLEPTTVAGFNQLFDDLNGTRSRFYGVAALWRLNPRMTAGLEGSRRDLDEPEQDLDVERWLVEDRREWTGRAYWNWAPADRIAVRTSFVYDRYTAESGIATLADNLPERALTRSLPIGLRYFDPNGLFAGATVTGVKQTVRRDPEASQAQGKDEFAVVDLDLGYRLPRRRGVVSLSVRNLFEEEFRYQDDSYREFRDEPSIGPYFPTRMLMARVVLGY